MKTSEFVYIHLPFCDVICHYCDFYTARAKDARHEELFSALGMERELYQDKFAPKLKAIYFGGGTPGVSPPTLLHKFLDQFRAHIDEKTEITLEVNPNNVTKESVAAWKQAGFTRVSMGIQSLRNDLLKKLGRVHSADDAKNALELCLKQFGNVTGDLIYGVPDQGPLVPAEDAETLASLGLPHISAYHLSLAKEHFLFSKLPDDELAFAQIEALSKILAMHGFRHYEISNFSKPGFESRNNQNYWLGGAYLALGPSAHGFDGEAERWHNIPNWEKYCAQLASGISPVESRESLSLEQRKIEYLFTRLRLETGINLSEFNKLFGCTWDAATSPILLSLIKEGLGLLQEGHFIPTFRGRMLGDELVQKFL